MHFKPYRYNGGMATNPTRERKRFLSLFERYVNARTNTMFDKEFKEDVLRLRNESNIREPVITIVDELDNFTEEPSPLTRFMLRYGLPVAMEDFIYCFVMKDEIDTSLLKLGIYIVDEDALEATGGYKDSHDNFQKYTEDIAYRKNLELTLSIPLDATNLQIREAIRVSNDFIKQRQKELGGSSGKTYPRFSAQLHSRILELSEEYNSKDVAAKISTEYPNFNPTDSYIRKVISQEKRRRQT